MDASQLKILLSKLEGFADPEPRLEQYVTPSDVAARFLNTVRMQVDGDELVDLGSGTGVLSIGAAALGFTVRGYEQDPDAIQVAEQNLAQAEEETGELDVTFIQADVEDVDDEADVVAMNPPFGIQDDDANLRFLEAAFSVADEVFALLHSSEAKRDETRQFIKEFASNRGFDATVFATYRFRLPNSMAFHEREQARIGVDAYHFTR
ncbi:MAG: methyltransferase [Candidatus Nanohaloarchaea archaeon]|nr:methyltransferase [Candidatus Nanohaloarchaea archaeon]